MRKVKKILITGHLILLLIIFVDNLGANYRVKSNFFEEDDVHVFSLVCKTIFCEYSLSNKETGDLFHAKALMIKVLFTHVVYVRNFEINDKSNHSFYYKGIDFHDGRNISTVTYKLMANHELFVEVNAELVIAFGAMYYGRLSTFESVQKYFELPSFK